MSNTIPPIIPFPDGGQDDDSVEGVVPTQEVDGELTVDPDADDSQVSSVDADRLASGADEGTTDPL